MLNITFFNLLFLIHSCQVNLNLTENITNNSTNNTNSNITNSFCYRQISNCLSCKENNCLFCDIFNGFFPNINNTTCESCNNSKTNCLFALSCGNCQICDIGYTWCSGNCNQNLINCSQGDPCTNVCSKCEKNYFLNGQICSQVTNIVENCDVYSSATNCLSCLSGFNLSTNDNIQTCISTNSNINNNQTPILNNNQTTILNNNTNSTLFPKLNNCFVHLGNRFTCSSCTKKNSNNTMFNNYDIINPYRQLENRFLNSTFTNITNTINTFTSFNSFSALINKNDICFSKSIENCLSTKSGTLECNLCMNNYYLLNGICYRSSINKINNCSKYLLVNSNLICETCNNEYYKNNEGLCTKFTEIIGCYSYNEDRSECVSCNNSEGYKLNGISCINIQNFNKIENCISYNENGLNEGKCNSCNSNSIFDITNNACRSILNCLSYNFIGTTLTCTNCKEGFILESNNTRCSQLSLSLNCLINTPQTSTNCSVCKAGYFVTNNNICSNQRNNNTYISNCEEGQTNYFCRKCLNNFLRVPKVYYCKPTIENCLFYNSNNNSCLICGNGMIPNTDGNCTWNPTNNISQCNIYNNNSICRSCNPGYYLQGNSCIQPSLSNSLNICSQNPISGLNINRINSNTLTNINNIPPIENNCTSCLVDSFLPDTVNRNICVPKLKTNSNHPYQDPPCNDFQIRIRFYNRGNKISTCRSISDLIVSGSRYQLDDNCYIYNSNFDNYTYYTASNTLCLICNSGFSIQNNNNRCSPINNCTPSNNNFGGCSSCETGFSLEFNGINCVTPISNCRDIIGDRCLRCNDNYYGVLASPINYGANDYGQQALLGFYGEALPFNYRDTNRIKIPHYYWFFYDRNNTQFKFMACRNSILFRGNTQLTGASNVEATRTQTNRTLAIIDGRNYAAYCRRNTYMIQRSGWYCESLVSSTSYGYLNNNYNNQAFNGSCNGSSVYLSISRGVIGGPFCVSNSGFNINNDPIRLGITAIGNCFLYSLDWTDYTRNPNNANRRCLICNLNFYSNGASCLSLDSTNDLVAYCNNSPSSFCNSCPNGYSFVNNACVKSNQLLWTGGLTIEQFRITYNCNIISWNQNIAGYRMPFVLQNNNDNLIATCLTCNTNFILNYGNFTCVEINLFNFDDCLITQNNIGCVSCSNGKIPFGVDTEHQFCINRPLNNYFIDSEPEPNCILYEFSQITKRYHCYECSSGYTLLNSTCFINTLIANCQKLLDNNKCSLCNDGYYLMNGYCIKGNIYKCLQYSSQYICNKCETNYTLWGNNNYVTCIDSAPIRSNFSNCNEVRSTNNFQNFYCFCQNGIIPLINNSLDNSICLPHYIDNCIRYDQINLTQCIQCKSDKLSDNSYMNNKFILDNNKCVERNQQQLIDNCEIYINNEVLCDRCSIGYYLDNNYKCSSNPILPPNCRYTSNNNTCLICNFDYYLNSNNTCLAVNSSNLVNNCYKYNNNEECIICIRGYLLNQTTKKCDILNYLLFLDENESCVFDLINGYPNNQCICKNNNQYYNKIERKCISVINCLEVENNGLCKQCVNEYYFDSISMNCEEVTNKINNCDLYSNNGICSQCINNYGLENNECFEVNNEDKIINCNRYSNQPQCILCNPGYYNLNGTCQNLNNNNIYFSSYNNQSIGIICRRGSTMNVDRNCISNDPINNNSTIKSNILKKLFLILIIINYI